MLCYVYCSVLQCVAVCCSVLQCVAVRCSALQCVAVCGSALQCVAVRCSVLQCVAVCCDLVQCVAVCGIYCISLHRHHALPYIMMQKGTYYYNPCYTHNTQHTTHNTQHPTHNTRLQSLLHTAMWHTTEGAVFMNMSVGIYAFTHTHTRAQRRSATWHTTKGAMYMNIKYLKSDLLHECVHEYDCSWV